MLRSLAGAAAIGGLAGCTGGGGGDEAPVDTHTRYVSTVPLAYYNTYLHRGDPMVSVDLDNAGSSPVELRVTSVYRDVSEPAVDQVTVPGGESRTVDQVPVVKPDAATAVTTTTSVSLAVTIERRGGDGWATVVEHAPPVEVYPLDTALLWQRTSDGSVEPLYEYLAAFVTPQAAAVQELLATAKRYHPDGVLTGYQCGDCGDDEWYRYTASQVAAIYHAAKEDYGISYLNLPTAFGRVRDFVQRVNTPRRSLALQSTNCLDGTLLFASALEALGIEPEIVVVPGHAFLVWNARPGGLKDALETTAIGDADFATANRLGRDEMHRFGSDLDDGNYDNGEAMPVSRARRDGVVPLA